MSFPKKNGENAGLTNNGALNHLLGLGKAQRIDDNTTLTTDMIGFLPINGDVVLDSETDSDIYAAADVLREGIWYPASRTTALQITTGSVGALLVFEAGQSDEQGLET